MKRLIFLMAGFVLLIALIGWRLNLKRAAVEAQDAQRKARASAPAVVTVAPVQIRDIVETFEAVGSVEAPFNVRLAPRVTGQINFVQGHEGDRVTRGQVLVRIDPADLNSQVRQQQAALAEAQYRLAQARLNQNPTNVSVSTTIQQQEAALASAQADYNQVVQNYAAQKASAAAEVAAAQGKVSSAQAAITNGDAAIRSAQANLENARAQFKRISALFAKGFVSAEQNDNASTQVSVQEAAVDVAKGQKAAAIADHESAQASMQAAQQQAEIVKTKGKADIEAARARVNQAQAALQYARANSAQMPAYQQNLAALRSTVAVAQAALHSAESRKADTVLKAPLDGFITARYMDPGSLATPGQPILAIQAIQQIWVTVPVPEEVSRKIRLGQSARVTLDGLPGREFIGNVTQINPSADPQSRQFAVRVTLNNTQNLIKPGMFARVKMETERERNSIVVPREAVQNGKDGATVVIVNSANTAQKREVSVGGSDAVGIAILQGVQAGEKVVTMSSSPLKDGQSVRVENHQTL